MTTATDNALDRFAATAAKISMTAAADVIRTSDVGKLNDTDCGLLCDYIRAEVKERINEAFDDARAALDANMGSRIADATFTATMRLAGITAANKFVDWWHGDDR